MRALRTAPARVNGLHTNSRPVPPQLVPYWAAVGEVAHTLAAEAACLGDHRPPKELATITRPALVVDSGQGAGSRGMSGLPNGFFASAADAIADLVPQVERRTLTDQGHVGAPDVLGPVLKAFFQ